jgi:hypothetical protein
MREIRIRERNDNNKYYLLDTRELKDDEVSELVRKFLRPDEKATIIDEVGGIKFSANQLLVLVRDEDNNYLNVISFENENDFIYL